MDDTTRRRRGISIVHKQLHYRYVGLMVLVVLAISIIMSIFIFLGTFDTINVLKQLAEGNAPLVESLKGTQISNLLRVLMALILILIAVGVVGVMEMSKIGGPLYRISQTAEKVAEGDYSMTFKLRNGDIPQAVGDAFGRMIDSVREKTQEEEKALESVVSKLKSISGRMQEGNKPEEEIGAAISILSQICEKKKKAIEPPKK